MSDINQINAALERIEKEIAECSNQYNLIATESAGKRVIYDIAWATNLLKISTQDGKKTVGEKEAMTLLAVEAEFTECRIAEAKAESAKRRLQSLQSELSSVQTRASLLKTEHRLDSYRP